MTFKRGCSMPNYYHLKRVSNFGDLTIYLLKVNTKNMPYLNIIIYAHIVIFISAHHRFTYLILFVYLEVNKCFNHNFLSNLGYLWFLSNLGYLWFLSNFGYYDFLKTWGFLSVFLSLETLAREMKILAFKLKTLKIQREIIQYFLSHLTVIRKQNMKKLILQNLRKYTLCATLLFYMVTRL